MKESTAGDIDLMLTVIAVAVLKLAGLSWGGAIVWIVGLGLLAFLANGERRA